MGKKKYRNKPKEDLKEKPIDRWLALGSLGVGIMLFLLPKTPAVVIGALILIFILLTHPIWNFWWIEKKNWRRVSALILLSGMLVFAGFISWPKQPGSSTPFGVEVRSAFVSDSGPLTALMVEYPSMFGQTASPVFYLAYIRITNLQDIASTINELNIAASKESIGPWEELVPVPLGMTSLYWLAKHSIGTKTPISKTIRMMHGTHRLSTPMEMEDMKYAILLSANPALESELTNAIPPHHSISGWVALDSRVHKGLTPGQIYFRVTLRDTADRSGSYVTSLPIAKPTDSSIDVNNGEIQVRGPISDISEYHVKYYSDPFPTPKRH